MGKVIMYEIFKKKNGIGDYFVQLFKYFMRHVNELQIQQYLF